MSENLLYIEIGEYPGASSGAVSLAEHSVSALGCFGVSEFGRGTAGSLAAAVETTPSRISTTSAFREGGLEAGGQ
ncbi:MAG: hypothetical protein ABIJ61_06835 [bacterium]